jgi:hypothetical protein
MMAGAKPKKPSLAARRRAMMASGAAGAPSGRAEAMMAAMPAMKKGGEMESSKVHKAEMKQLSGLKKELTKHEDMPASKGHRGLKAGGAAKKFAEGGRVQHDGGPEQMKQGKKKPAGPVSINQLSGTYKKGGAVMMATGGLTSAMKASQLRSEQIKASFAAAAKASSAASQSRNDAIRASVAASQSRATAASQSRTATVRQSQPIPITPAQARSLQAKAGGYWNDTLKYKVVGGPTPIPPQLRVTVSKSMPRPVPSAMPMPQVTPMPKPVVTPMVSEMPQSGYGGGYGDGGFGGGGGGGGGMRRGGKVQYNGKKRGAVMMANGGSTNSAAAQKALEQRLAAQKAAQMNAQRAAQMNAQKAAQMNAQKAADARAAADRAMAQRAEATRRATMTKPAPMVKTMPTPVPPPMPVFRGKYKRGGAIC